MKLPLQLVKVRPADDFRFPFSPVSATSPSMGAAAGGDSSRSLSIFGEEVLMLDESQYAWWMSMCVRVCGVEVVEVDVCESVWCGSGGGCGLWKRWLGGHGGGI